MSSYTGRANLPELQFPYPQNEESDHIVPKLRELGTTAGTSRHWRKARAIALRESRSKHAIASALEAGASAQLITSALEAGASAQYPLHWRLEPACNTSALKAALTGWPSLHHTMSVLKPRSGVSDLRTTRGEPHPAPETDVRAGAVRRAHTGEATMSDTLNRTTSARV